MTAPFQPGDRVRCLCGHPTCTLRGTIVDAPDDVPAADTPRDVTLRWDDDAFDSAWWDTDIRLIDPDEEIVVLEAVWEALP
jgi:hypothetical protein